MSIEHVKGDVVKALQNKEIDYMIHVCNNKGVQSAGVAKQIKETFPDAFEVYRKQYDKEKGETLGLTSLDRESGVINMVAQDGYGYGKRFLHYGALAKTLIDVKETICYDCDFVKGMDAFNKFCEGEIKIGLPYLMGSDRAGGDWTIVKELVEGLLSEDFKVYIYHLN